MNDFSTFWQKYPRKLDKKSAEKAWNALLKRGIDPGLIIALLEIRIRIDWRNRAPEYIPYPASWLRAESFEHVEDEPMALSLFNFPKKKAKEEDETELRARAELLQKVIQNQQSWWDEDRAKHIHTEKCQQGKVCRFSADKRPSVPSVEELMEAMRVRV